MSKEATRDDVIARLYPEVVAGGYARQDGFVDFYVRVRSLLTPDSVVLDFGAGRGEWTDPDTPPVFRDLRDLQSKAARVVGVDVDSAVLDNTSLDEAYQVDPAGRLPFEDETFDLVLADYVLEHVDPDDAASVAAELGRVLKPGGWLCARTPNVETDWNRCTSSSQSLARVHPPPAPAGPEGAGRLPDPVRDEHQGRSRPAPSRTALDAGQLWVSWHPAVRGRVGVDVAHRSGGRPPDPIGDDAEPHGVRSQERRVTRSF